MSGSGGGGGGGGGGYASPAATCSTLVIRTTLNSPKPDVIKTLKVGEILEVSFTPPKGPVEVRKGSRVAGSITAAEMVQLIECIAKGHKYEAVVTAINEGKVDVTVRLKR